MDDCRWMAFRAEDGTIVVPLVAETDSTVSRITYKEQSLEGDLRFSNLGVTSGWHSNMERSRAFAGKGIESDVLHAGDETLKSQVGGGAIRVFETNGRWGAEVIADIANILFTDSGIWVYQLN